MKTVKPKVLSSTRIQLSKAASILSKFVSIENGASQAVGAYLRRASKSFNELAYLHKVLKSSSSGSLRKTHSGYETEATIGGEENGTRALKRIQEPSRTGDEAGRKRHNMKSDEKGGFVNSFNEGVKLEARAEEATPVRNGVDGILDAEGGKKQHKKRRKERGDVGNSEDGFQSGKVETGDKFQMNEVEAKERKKKKSVEVEVVGEIGFEEQRSKKKRRKSGDEDNRV